MADRLPLRTAIAAAVEEPARRGGLETALEIELDDGSGWASLLLSLARELVANVAEHADARHVHVSLRHAGARIVLEVADDGAGFDPAGARPEGHFGLSLMTDVARNIGADLAVRTAVGQGTTWRLTIAR